MQTRYKVPARLAKLGESMLRAMIKRGLLDVAPLCDADGRAVLVLSDAGKKALNHGK